MGWGEGEPPYVVNTYTHGQIVVARIEHHSVSSAFLDITVDFRSGQWSQQK